MPCYAGNGYTEDKINGVCPDCGEPTVDGEAYECCIYSYCECETCDYRPCDGSCQETTTGRASDSPTRKDYRNDMLGKYRIH